MTKEEAIKELEEDKALYMPEEWIESLDRDTPDGRLITALDMAISALKGLDLPDNATNEDAFNYMLRQTFPKTIFIHFHNEANLTEGVVMTREWLSEPYKKGE